MKYLILLLLIPAQLFSCECGLKEIFFKKRIEFFKKAEEMEGDLSIDMFSKVLPKEAMIYYKLGAMDAYYDCFYSLEDP